MRKSAKNRKPGVECRALIIAALAVSFSIFAAGICAAQPVAGHANDFSSIEYYPAPNQTLMKTRMAGAEAQPLAGGLLAIRQLKLETFGTNASPEAIVEAPECIYDTQRGMANSSGHLRAQNGDGKIRIEGNGFLWRQDDSFLTISNDVKTLIVSLALASAGSAGAVAQTNSATATNAAPNVTRIASDHGDFDMTEGRRQAVYTGHVRVDDPQMRLTCERLVADMPESGSMNHIVARTNVVIDFTDDRGQTNHATSDKAVYSVKVQNGATNRIVTLTGNARVDNAQMTLTGEPIYVDVENKQMHADDQKMIFKESFETGMTKTNSPAAGTNNPASPKTNLPPGSVEGTDRINSPSQPGSSEPHTGGF